MISTSYSSAILKVPPKPSDLFGSASSGVREPRSSVQLPYRFSSGAPVATAWDSPAGASRLPGLWADGPRERGGVWREARVPAPTLASPFTSQSFPNFAVAGQPCSPFTFISTPNLFALPAPLPCPRSLLPALDPTWAPSNACTPSRSLTHDKSRGRN